MATFQSGRSETMNLPGARTRVSHVLRKARSMETAALRGLGVLDPNGATSGTNWVTVNTADLQRQLIRAGYAVGHTGADGVYGPATAVALQTFVNRILPAEQYSASGSTDGGTVRITPPLVWNMLKAQASAPTGNDGAPARRSPTTSPAPASVESPAVAGSSVGWIGVVLAGAGVLGVAAAIFFGRKKR